jgi:hypothetical protein
MGHLVSRVRKVTFRCKILEGIQTMDNRLLMVLQLLAIRRPIA